MTVFTGGFANDTFTGGSSNDSISGGGGNDSLNGGAGNDTIYGGIGNDTLLGGTGNDFLSGDLGSDYLYGGTGDDTYSIYMGSALDRFNEVNGGGYDVIQIPNATLSSVHSERINNDYSVCTLADWNFNGINDYGFIIQNQFLGGNYKIELIAFSDTVLYL